VYLSPRKIMLLVTLVLSVAVSVLAWSFEEVRSDQAVVIQLLPDDLKWNSDPKLHGLQTVTLAGNPNAPEPYAERIKLPANFRLAPHSHPNEARMVIVLSGTLYYAYGDEFEEAKLIALPAGSFFTEPKDMPHYAVTKEEVILQLNAIGPAGTKYLETEQK
jgi:quercetin dioxygenase-like cupin family protein